MAAQVETCYNCDTKIGRMEQAYLWQDSVVCETCYNKLSARVPKSSGTPSQKREGLTACKACGCPVSTDAAKCPHCGKRLRMGGCAFAFYAACIIVAVAYASAECRNREAESQSTQVSPPRQARRSVDRAARRSAVLAKYNYTVLPLKPGQLEGWHNILLHDELEADEIRSFIKAYVAGKKSIWIYLYTDRRAYEDWIRYTSEADFDITDTIKRHQILLFIRNPEAPSYKGNNCIQWLQEEGKFSSLHGTREPL